MDFVGHLKEAVNTGELTIGTSKLQDWFALLSLQQIKELSEMFERIKTNSKPDIDRIVMLAYLLCLLEGIDLFEKYKDDVTESVELLSTMVSLEHLKRCGKIRLHNKLSFAEDCQIELLDFQHPGH